MPLHYTGFWPLENPMKMTSQNWNACRTCGVPLRLAELPFDFLLLLHMALSFYLIFFFFIKKKIIIPKPQHHRSCFSSLYTPVSLPHGCRRNVRNWPKRWNYGAAPRKKTTWWLIARCCVPTHSHTKGWRQSCGMGELRGTSQKDSEIQICPWQLLAHLLQSERCLWLLFGSRI